MCVCSAFDRTWYEPFASCTVRGNCQWERQCYSRTFYCTSLSLYALVSCIILEAFVRSIHAPLKFCTENQKCVRQRTQLTDVSCCPFQNKGCPHTHQMTQLTPPHETNDAKPRTPLYLDRICTFTASNHAFSPPAAYRYVTGDRVHRQCGRRRPSTPGRGTLTLCPSLFTKQHTIQVNRRGVLARPAKHSDEKGRLARAFHVPHSGGG